MSYYRTCADCGDNLDPGERCKCKQKAEQRKNGPVKITYPAGKKRHAG